MKLSIPFHIDDFDAHIETALGCYVYVLMDGDHPFYVGKGGGIGDGNNRVLNHLKDARALWDTQLLKSEKIQRIHKIWKKGAAVQWKVIRYGLPSSQSALEVEAALIDLIEIDNLTNTQAGHGTKSGGLLSSRDVYRFSAPFVYPKHKYKKVLLYPVH